jgi:periplasmic protein TonB
MEGSHLRTAELSFVPGVPRPTYSGRGRILFGSVAAHALVVAFLVLYPLFRPERPGDRPDVDTIRVLIYDPPPPPPPPLPKGAAEGGRVPRSVQAPVPAPTPVASENRMEAPVEVVAPSPDRTALTEDRVGSPTGSDAGVAEGMEGGVEGGVVGGVPGGVLGGVIGGTGTGPVPVFDYDRPPRLVRQTKPKYPPDAFVKKVQGIVLVEFLVDTNGRVSRARVIQSIPMLDAAALEAVRDWVFYPALRRGQPVATLARAPVSFTIY